MTQIQNFLASANDTTVVKEQPSNREPLKHLLIGSRRTVTSTIHHLQVIGYADVGDWSEPIPTGNVGEFMSILIRQILIK
ncbi:hypothetical protein VB713_12955 [Anabaena cylindrica UHCC 0172]|uniref:hypothetical protein n=1 Tax=Anabaena cylindrica TaxID=1165 RepID=UPI002B1FF086|nr:hypothetical protein [Anabaena cylindrica]MEA5551854.1 hypothetical protein [Anabaena cylindrica UHCC 0172]